MHAEMKFELRSRKFRKLSIPPIHSFSIITSHFSHILISGSGEDFCCALSGNYILSLRRLNENKYLSVVALASIAVLILQLIRNEYNVIKGATVFLVSYPNPTATFSN